MKSLLLVLAILTFSLISSLYANRNKFEIGDCVLESFSEEWEPKEPCIITAVGTHKYQLKCPVDDLATLFLSGEPFAYTSEEKEKINSIYNKVDCPKDYEKSK